MPLVVSALSQAVAAGRMKPLNVQKLNGKAAFSLRDYGAAVTHKGAKIGGSTTAPPKRRGRTVAEAMDELSFDD